MTEAIKDLETGNLLTLSGGVDSGASPSDVDKVVRGEIARKVGKGFQRSLFAPRADQRRKVVPD